MEQAIAERLVSIATYPWVTNSVLDWNQTLALDSDFPTFPTCRAVYLTGPVRPDGRTHIDEDRTGAAHHRGADHRPRSRHSHGATALT